MFRFLRNFQIDFLSYFLGLITGLLVIGVSALLKVAIPKLRAYLAERVTTARKEMSAGADAHFRREVLRNAQKSHMAWQLFKLDEILVKPVLQALPPIMLPGSNLLDEREAALTIPYLPDWPELPAMFNARTITIAEALSQGASIAITGVPGAGKSTALAYLASEVARQTPDAGVVRDHLPVLIHALDLGNSVFAPSGQTPKLPIDILTDTVIRRASLLMQPRIPALIRGALGSGQLLLMIDGVDELPQEQVKRVNAFLEALLRQYPKIRVVLATSPDNYDGVLSLGILPVALSAWSEIQRTEFLNRWAEQWETYIAPGLQQGTAIDPLILKGWLSSVDQFATPLEQTLKFWAAFSGDTLGPNLPASLDSYLLRLTIGIPRAREALEKLAAEMIKAGSSSASTREAEAWLSQLKHFLGSEGAATAAGVTMQEGSPSPAGWQQTDPQKTEVPQAETEGSPDDAPGDAAAAEGEPGAKKAPQKAARMSPAQEMLARLVNSGLLIKRQDRYSFVQPTVMGYLAAAGLTREPDPLCITPQPEWSGKQAVLPFLAASVDLSPIAKTALEETQDPLYRKLLSAGRWLRLAPAQARWRGGILRSLVSLVQSELYSLTLRSKALAALVSSGDPGIPPLLRQMFGQRQESTRVLAALGCGLARDQKSVSELIQLTGDSSIKVAQAAVFSLTVIGTRQALDGVAQILLEGTEELRRAAAEALAFLPEEGHPTLKEGSTHEDLLVRRAVVYGLARVNEPWALETLQQMQIEDGQWVVRSAATQSIEELQKREVYYPQNLPQPQDAAWLLAFASKQGLGVLPGKPAFNLILQALKSEDIYEVFAALAYLERTPDAGGVSGIYGVMYGSGGEVKEAAYHSLYQLAGAGVELPSPAQFGLG